jgi:DNA-binding beta-propeller fold protein YncE
LLGSSPNAVTVSPNGRTLYVANASQNAVRGCRVDGARHESVDGLIPDRWYPTAVALDATGDRLFIASGYGFGSIAPVAAVKSQLPGSRGVSRSSTYQIASSCHGSPTKCATTQRCRRPTIWVRPTARRQRSR